MSLFGKDLGLVPETRAVSGDNSRGERRTEKETIDTSHCFFLRYQKDIKRKMIHSNNYGHILWGFQ